MIENNNSEPIEAVVDGTVVQDSNAAVLSSMSDAEMHHLEKQENGMFLDTKTKLVFKDFEQYLKYQGIEKELSKTARRMAAEERAVYKKKKLEAKKKRKAQKAARRKNRKAR